MPPPTQSRPDARLLNIAMQILNTGSLTSATDLIAGLMARASELSRDRFRTAATETMDTCGSGRRLKLLRRKYRPLSKRVDRTGLNNPFADTGGFDERAFVFPTPSSPYYALIWTRWSEVEVHSSQIF